MAAKSQAQINVFDGRRSSFSDKGKLLITVRNGNQQVVYRDFQKKPSILLKDLAVTNGPADFYSFLVSAPGYKDAGMVGVQLLPGITQTVNLMLIPQSAELNFSTATWAQLCTLKPGAQRILSAADGDAEARFNDMKDVESGDPLACLLNILTSSEQIHLPQGTLLDYIQDIIWTGDDGACALKCDRFFGYINVAVIDQLEQAVLHGEFERAPAALHKNATRSFKQIEFGEANVQVTLHENDKRKIGKISCVKVELDIDYYRSKLSHLLLEVAVNQFGSVTDPKAVYALRWHAGQKAGRPEFNPLYTIQRGA